MGGGQPVDEQEAIEFWAQMAVEAQAEKQNPGSLGRGAKPHAAFIRRASGAGCQTPELPLQGPSTLRNFLPITLAA